VSDEKLFPYLKGFRSRAEGPDTMEYKIGEIFSEIENKFRSGYSLRDALELVDQRGFRSQEQRHELSALYEDKLRRMGNAGRNGGAYYTPRPLNRRDANTPPAPHGSAFHPVCAFAPRKRQPCGPLLFFARAFKATSQSDSIALCEDILEHGHVDGPPRLSNSARMRFRLFHPLRDLKLPAGCKRGGGPTADCQGIDRCEFPSRWPTVHGSALSKLAWPSPGADSLRARSCSAIRNQSAPTRSAMGHGNLVNRYIGQYQHKDHGNRLRDAVRISEHDFRQEPAE
jgi:hypothetical protein